MKMLSNLLCLSARRLATRTTNSILCRGPKNIRGLSSVCQSRPMLVGPCRLKYVENFLQQKTTRSTSNLFYYGRNKLQIGNRGLASANASEDDCVVEELKKLIDDENVYLVDVRRPDELKEHGKIPGSLNIPLDTLEAALNLPDEFFEERYGRKKPSTESGNVVFHCRSGVRSLSALQIARKYGFDRCNVWYL